MEAVIINGSYNCLKYVLERGGYSLPELTDTSLLEKFFTIRKYTKGEDIKIGELLLWDMDTSVLLWSKEITKEGLIITHRRASRRHVGIYEGNGYVSDLSSGTGQDGLSLSLTLIDDPEPDFILTLK